MKIVIYIVWIGIAVCFVRGLFAFDMGPSGKDTYPVAGGVCLAGAVVAASIMVLAASIRFLGRNLSPKRPRES